MKLKLWGTRGSLPRALGNRAFVDLVDGLARKAEKAGLASISDFRNALRDGDLGSPLVFGGNTTCTEVIHGNTRLFVDMGTGIQDAGYEALAAGRTEFKIFLTHLHWDHIMGMPFFPPLYIPGTKVTIYHVHANAPDHVRIQFNGVNFPVKWENLGAQVEFHRLKMYESTKIGAVSVAPFALDHPGGCFGYRFEAAGKSAAIGVDGEYKRFTREELGKDLAFYQNLDVLIFDAQYEMDELANRFDWGHCSPPIGVELALREGIKNIILTHHDPRASEERSTRMRDHAVHHLQSRLPQHKELWNSLGQPDGPRVISGYDGLELDVENL